MTVKRSTNEHMPGLGIQARRVGMWFDKRGVVTDVCQDVTIDVSPGEFVSIVGPSGCGKTTFLKIIGGLVAPEAGEVVVGGHPVRGPGSDRGFVFQHDGLFPWRTLRDNIRFGLEVQGVDAEESIALVDPIIALVGLGGFGDHYPHELSGGMRQRANLARALAIDPSILLMDEPFSALDAQTREFMQEELLRVWSEKTKTVVFITHQIDEAAYLSDRVAIMSARPGRIRDIVSIDLPRPRKLSIKRSPEFLKYTERIWRQVEEEVHRSGAMR